MVVGPAFPQGALVIGLRILNCFLDDFRKNVSRRKPTNDQSARFSVLKEQQETVANRRHTGLDTGPSPWWEGLTTEDRRWTTKFKWAGNQEAVTFLGYRPIRP
jgi:hypothetical protein